MSPISSKTQYWVLIECTPKIKQITYFHRTMVQSKQFYFKREEWAGGGGSKQRLTKTKPTSKANTKSLSSTSSIWVLMESTPNDSVIPPHQLCCLSYNTISYIGSTSLVPVRCLSRYPMVSASSVSWGVFAETWMFTFTSWPLRASL